MSKLYEALKRLESKKEEKENPWLLSPTKKKERKKFVLPAVIFLLAVIFGIGLVYLIEWRLSNTNLAFEKNIPTPVEPATTEKAVAQEEAPAPAPEAKKTAEKEAPKAKKAAVNEAPKTKKRAVTAKKAPSLEHPSLKVASLQKASLKKEKSPEKEGPLTEKAVEKKDAEKTLRSVGPPVSTTAVSLSNSGERYLFLAEEARRRGDLEEAVMYLKRYPKLHQHAEALNNLGALFLLLGQTEKAASCFRESLALKADPEVAYNLIVAYLRLDQRQEACRLASYYKDSAKVKALWEIMSCSSSAEEPNWEKEVFSPSDNGPERHRWPRPDRARPFPGQG